VLYGVTAENSTSGNVPQSKLVIPNSVVEAEPGLGR
jgi:hypothetical protein